LEYCNNKEDGLAINGLIYELAQKTQKNGLCGSVCSRKIYSSALNYLSERVLSKELKVYGKGYCIIWAFYSSLYVNEKIETYVFDFDTALVAVGGSLGLFLGKVIYPKYAKHLPYIVAHTIECVCSKMSNHGFNHGLFISLFKFFG
jgi:hypothetical protein